MTLAIITGSSAGLGFHAALGLARAGHDRIVITSRSLSRAKEAVDKLSQLNKATEFIALELQMHDLDQVKFFAEEVTAQLGKWDLLLNNAGAKIERPAKTTKQGFEWHFGVNHLAHFALTSWLKASAAKGARVVSNASLVARKGEPRFWQDPLKLSAAQQYAGSKLANLCFAIELHDRELMDSTAAHPGFARASAYGNRGLRLAEYIAAQPASLGAEPLIAASGKEVPSGSYVGPRVLELWGKPALLTLPESANEKNRKELWQLSESLLGAKF